MRNAPQGQWKSKWPKVGAMALAMLVLGVTFRELDLLRVGELLRGVPLVGWPLIVLPQLASLAVETAGFREAFLVLGQRPAYLSLLRIRLATEALAQTLPFGAVLSESVKPLLLGRLCGVPLSEAVAGTAARKYLLLLSQSVYVGVMVALGFASLQAASTAVIGVQGLGYGLLATALGLLVAALGTRALLARGGLARRALGLLLHVRGTRAFFRAHAARFEATDGALGRYFAPGARADLPALVFFAAWLIEALETFLIVRMLGIELDFATVAAFEVALSLVRNVVFVVPSGLGIQDLGYVAFFSALGVPEPLSVGGAFVLLKRSKELFWSLVGFALLASEPRAARASRAWG